MSPQPLPSPTPMLHLGPGLLRDPRAQGQRPEPGRGGGAPHFLAPTKRQKVWGSCSSCSPPPALEKNERPPPQLWAGARGQRGRGRVTVLRCSLPRPRDGPPRPLALNKPWPLPSPFFSWISLRPKSPITVSQAPTVSHAFSLLSPPWMPLSAVTLSPATPGTWPHQDGGSVPPTVLHTQWA